MGTKLMRLYEIYGRGNPIPVGHTKFYEDIVYREGGDEFIPGTDIPRLRLTNLSERVRVGFEDEVHAIAEALRARRDAKLAGEAA
jgi:hypothetical protein